MPSPAATLAGQIIAAAVQKFFDPSFVRNLYQLFNGKPDYQTEELMKMLQIQQLSVRAALDKAEEEKIMNPDVILWVEKLQEALDDAENLWLEIVAETAGYESNSSPNTLDQIRNYFTSVNLRLGERIKMMEQVVNIKNVIDVKQGKRKREFALSLPTTSFPDIQEPVYGRKSDMEIITPYLSSENEGIIVLAIVGMAGIGKTTFSQLLFNDQALTFNLKSWVYVSKISSVLDLTKKIYASVTSSSTGITDLNLLQKMDSETTDLNLLQKKLSSRLEGKRFLLVLDDFWSEKPQEWNLVKGPLTKGAPGSVIIVTTQNKNVALTLRATVTHTLPILGFNDCQKIFARHAFGSEDAGGDETLKEIGEKIVRKCKGLPLSAKVLGSLLCSKDDPWEWDNILNCKIWDLPADRSNILPSLLVSYQHLPLHLKRCFAFCSLFPKGQATKKWKLISLWMAYDLLPHAKTGKTVEKLGDEYLCELMSRSFVQQSTEDELDFVMHDLMSELAQYVGGEIFFKLEVSNLHDIPKKVRHLSFLQNKINNPGDLQAFRSHSQLRTFFTLSDYSGASNPLNVASFEPMLNFLPSLRVLSLENYKISLPSSIEKLNHLTYLNLSNTEIDKLPDAKSFPNLIILLLSNCPRLNNLPDDLSKLSNLHRLDISGTTLEKMPPDFSELKFLNILTIFFVSNYQNASRVSELGALTQLCGSLSIVNLQNLLSIDEALKANLKEKKFLKELNLSWAGAAVSRPDRVLRNLEPHKLLQKLKVEGYIGTEFPRWIGRPSFSHMVSVHLNDCNSSKLPPLGNLFSLKTLHIKSMPIRIVNPEFYGNPRSTPFRSLKTLSFIDMLAWAEWPLAAFPSLEELHIEGCSSLTKSLNHEMPLLKKLEIFICPLLVQHFRSDPAYEELKSRLGDNIEIREDPMADCEVDLINLTLMDSARDLPVQEEQKSVT